MGSEQILDPHLQEWLNLGIRWLHIICGIAWIGSSFYFMWLDSSLRKNKALPDGVKGEVWAVHGGGFYHKIKYEVAPDKMPETLHWFKWEAYVTFITGFLLLCVVYYASASAYMVDPAVADLSGWEAVGIGVGTLLAWWVFYDLICKSPLGKKENLLFAVIFIAMIGVAFALYQVLSSRAAYMHVGAMVGTAMALNVFIVIIPNQKKMVASMLKGEAPDPRLGQKSKQRSVHNNYFTLGVVFVMISNHFPSTYGNEYGWAVLAVLFLMGAMIRHHYNMKHAGKKSVVLYPAAGVLFVALAIFTRPATIEAGEPVSFSEAQAIIQTHCYGCHGPNAQDPLKAAVPATARFDSPSHIAALATRIKARAVDTTAMPMGNRTGMTELERNTLGRWIIQGAKTE